MLFPIDVRGLGIATPYGFNDYETVSTIFEDSDGFDINQLQSFDKLRIQNFLSPHQHKMPVIRYMDIISKRAIVATHGCLLNAGLSDDDVHRETFRFGAIIATSRGPCQTRRKLFSTFRNRNQQSVSATLFSNCGYNIAASLVAGFFGMRGANLTIAGGDTLASLSMERSSVLLEKGFVDYMVVGYADSDPEILPDISQISMADFSCLFLISKAGFVQSETPTMRLEPVKRETVRKSFVWNDEPKIGHVYGVRDSIATNGHRNLLEDINLRINSKIVEKRCYLPFLQLAFLFGNAAMRSTWDFWVLPIASNDGMNFWKVSFNQLILSSPDTVFNGKSHEL